MMMRDSASKTINPSRASIDRLIWLLGEIKNDMAAEEPF
jgi:hypothetical protein